MNPDHKLDYWKLHAYRAWALIGIIILLGALGWVCGKIWVAVATVVVTALVVFFLHGIVNYVEDKGHSRTLGAIVAFLMLFVIVIGAFAIFIPALVEQLGSLVEQVPEYTEMAKTLLQNSSHLIDGRILGALQSAGFIEKIAETVSKFGTSALTGLATGVVAGIKSVSTTLLILAIGLLAGYWILIDLPKIQREIRLIMSDRYKDDVAVIAESFGTAIYGWAKSTLVCAVVNGVLAGIAFWILGLPYSLLLGLATGILFIIPYIGIFITAVVVVAVALLSKGLLISIIALVILMALHLVIANILSPRLMKSSVNVHPALTLIVILAGEALGGVIGMLAAVPLMAAAQSIFVAYFEARTGKELYSKDGALFHKVDVDAPLPNLADAGATLTNLKLPKNLAKGDAKTKSKPRGKGQHGKPKK